MSAHQDERGGPAREVRPPREGFRVGDRLVCPDLSRIVTPEATLQIEPKVMQVLLCLAARPGRCFAEALS